MSREDYFHVYVFSIQKSFQLLPTDTKIIYYDEKIQIKILEYAISSIVFMIIIGTIAYMIGL